MSTNTSPERYGLVRTIGTNTSPIEGDNSDNNLPDVAKSTLIVAEVQVHVPSSQQNQSRDCVPASENDDATENVSETMPDLDEEKRISV